ncbi:hypothetical protein FTV88_2560 [Heliorestis convoluta]|uniref:Uncharacterized protein n=1 Tax=Heliorestis convoluta TaxID=356322 RepID=A0A5Q2N427_9FIRM|nr:hypothetical protein FTV88_2560 [Heliorestis convoluta]
MLLVKNPFLFFESKRQYKRKDSIYRQEKRTKDPIVREVIYTLAHH